ncbi:sensor histidine kinase [Flavobacterium lindanitolerans]|uniref:sensor histidine kinase n=1 Tax=Flavobacterium lindanitolerans TaxID=428988 RepID=UPI0027BAD106|nr:ATP-binding protein [Flavobacterium lindanitolerans]
MERLVEDNSIISADRNQVSLVLRNLIDNAIKFTPLGGRIWFILQSIPEGVQFSAENEVADNPGIDIDNRIGNKMASATRGTGNEQGVGLGLILCQEYVKNNGGTFQVDQKENRIRFSVVLPGER